VEYGIKGGEGGFAENIGIVVGEGGVAEN